MEAIPRAEGLKRRSYRVLAATAARVSKSGGSEMRESSLSLFLKLVYTFLGRLKEKVSPVDDSNKTQFEFQCGETEDAS